VLVDVPLDRPRGPAPALLFREQHFHELPPPREPRLQVLLIASGSGRTGGRTTSAKCANTPASIASVLANRPVALAKSRTCRALSTTTGSAAIASAATTATS